MVLVTGSTGLLGSHLIFELLSHNYEVKALKRIHSDIDFVKKVLSYYSNDYEALFNKIIWVEGDINDVNSLYDAMDGVDCVYHTAAIVSFNHDAYALMKRVNSEGTANVVNMCLEKGIKKLCYSSSVASLGRVNADSYISEETWWEHTHRNSAYSITKYYAEQEVWRGIAEGLNTVMVNPSIIIGPGHLNRGSSKLFETVYHGQKFYTKGVNGFVDVRDVARIMRLLIEKDINSERFIVSSENLSYQYVLTEIAKQLEVPPPKYNAGPLLSSIAWRLEHFKSLITRKSPLITKETATTAQKHHSYDTKKIVNALNYTFIPVSKAIKDTALLYKKALKA